MKFIQGFANATVTLQQLGANFARNGKLGVDLERMFCTARRNCSQIAFYNQKHALTLHLLVEKVQADAIVPFADDIIAERW